MLLHRPGQSISTERLLSTLPFDGNAKWKQDRWYRRIWDSLSGSGFLFQACYCSQGGGVSDAVEDGVTGLMVEPDNPPRINWGYFISARRRWAGKKTWRGWSAKGTNGDMAGKNRAILLPRYSPVQYTWKKEIKIVRINPRSPAIIMFSNLFGLVAWSGSIAGLRILVGVDSLFRLSRFTISSL